MCSELSGRYNPGMMQTLCAPLAVAQAPPRTRCFTGFSLLEPLLVLVALGVLLSYVVPRYFSQPGRVRVETARSQIKTMAAALDQYRLDLGRYPGTKQGLAVLSTRPAGEAHWQGPYLREPPPVDPWGNAYHYRQPGEHGGFDLYSLGRDGQLGGTGEAADIVSW